MVDDTITQKMKQLLNEDLKEEDPNDPSHDFDPISHENCNYGKDKPLTIDVDKILGLAKSSSQVSRLFKLGHSLINNQITKFVGETNP